MSVPTRISGNDELFSIDEEEFLHGKIELEGHVADFDYDGGFGDDEDISDQTPEMVIGCQSWLANDAPMIDVDGSFIQRVGSLHRSKIVNIGNLSGPKTTNYANDNYFDAKEQAA